MTKSLSLILRGLICGIAKLLPRWKRATFLARLYESLQPFENVTIDDHTLKIYVPDRTSIYWVKDAPLSEPMTNRWIASLSSTDVLLDVGANVGFFSMLAASQGASKVYAIEPNPFSFDALCKNIISNDLQDVVMPINMAISEHSGCVEFAMSGTSVGSINNHISTGTQPGKLHLDMMAVSLDFLHAQEMIVDVTHIKIDIDGLELEVIKGSQQLLSSANLKSVLIEDDGNDANRQERDAIMHTLGYTISSDFGSQDQYTIFERTPAA